MALDPLWQEALSGAVPGGVAVAAIKYLLNGTKERTVRIETKIDAFTEKVDHLSERVSTIEGRLTE